jgi:uncharacterized Zn finger protein
VSQRKPKKAVPTGTQTSPVAALRLLLARRSKAELVDLLLETAQEDQRIFRQLTTRLDVDATPEELVAATRQAIADATHFDKREINRNFDYDDKAYLEVKQNLDRLIGMGQLRLAMQLSLELMKQGSYQVEMSDEGLMKDDIEDCFRPVLESIGKGDLPAVEAIAWCSAMLDNDRVKFIATEPLESLREKLQALAAQ